VGVVLGESADTRHAVEFARLFPAVDRAEFGEADRQVAVGVRLRGENLDMMRTIHRLQQEALDEFVVRQDPTGADHLASGALIDLRGEPGGHGLDTVGEFRAGTAFAGDPGPGLLIDERRKLGVLVIGKMTAGLIEFETANVRREHLLIALLAQLGRNECLQFLADDRTVGRPKHEALADGVVDDEQLEVLAELAMVAEFRLLKLVEIRGEFILGREGGAVDALELLVVLVAAVVGAGDRQQLEGFDLFRVADVGAGTQVGELAVLVE